MKKRLMALLLSALMLVSLLSGCCVLSEDTINADGTVATYTAVGFSQAYYKAMYDLNQSTETSNMTFEEFMAQALEEQEDATAFQHNGVTYYGAVEEKQLTDLEGYNNFRFPEEESDISSGNLSVDEAGNYVLTLTFTEKAVEEYADDVLIMEEEDNAE